MNAPHNAETPSRRTGLPAVLAALAVTVVSLALTAAPAGAAIHPSLGAFCEPTGLGTPPCQPTFGHALGMAVDPSSGDLLVIDANPVTQEDGVLKRFKPNGEPDPFSALGTNVIDGKGAQPCVQPSSACDGTPLQHLLGNESSTAIEVQVAVAPAGAAAGSAGNIYVTDAYEGETLDVFAPTGKYLTQLSGTGYACGVAVDPAGNVYVGDYEGKVHKYVPTAPDTFTNSANFTLSGMPHPCTLAAGTGPTAGFIFVAGYNTQVSKFDSSTGALKYPVSPGANTTVNVDPGTGHLYVARGKEIAEYDASGPLNATQVSTTELATTATGVAVNGANGKVYAARTFSSNVEVYGPLVPEIHPSLGAFCEPTGLGTPPCQPTFGHALGMAVDPSSGDLLVIDANPVTQEDGVLKRFKPNGEPDPFSALGTNVIDGKGAQPCVQPSSACDGTPLQHLLGNESSTAIEVQVAVAPAGAAAGSAGNIYVTDAYEGETLDVFAPTGKYLTQLSGTGYACGVAVDPAGNVYVGDYEGKVHKYVPTAPDTFTNSANFTLSGMPHPCTLAAGTGPTAGFIFVAGYNTQVSKFDSSTGALKYPVSPGANTTVNVDPGTGHLYVARGKEIAEYDASGPLNATQVSTTELATTATGVAVNGANGKVYAARTFSSNVEVYGPLTPLQGFKVAKNGNGTGSLACKVNGGSTEPCPETETLYPVGTKIVLTATAGPLSVFAGFSGGGCSTSPCTLTLAERTTVTATFNQIPPSVENNPEGTLTTTTAVLNGHVDNESDPAGSACSFEVTLATDTGFSSPVTTPACVPTSVAGSTSTAVTATATGLNPATSYIYRVVATNTGGTSKAAPVEPFTTPVGPPLVSAELAAPVTGTTATLNAKVNPSGLATNYHFEWGASASYDHRIPAEFDLFAGSGNQPVAVTAHLTGLALSSTYHFRVVATNSFGTTNGPDVAFTTNNFTELNSAGLPDNRRFELVSPADKRPQGRVEQKVGDFVGSQAAEDGQSLLFPLLFGLEDTDSGGNTSYLATRSSSGWQSTKVSPPSLVPAPTKGVLGEALSGQLVYASPDLSCQVINTFNPLTADTPVADVELGVYNLYRRNPDGSHTLITQTVPANPHILPFNNGESVTTVAGASSDCGRVYFRSEYRYLPNPTGFYEWDEGTLRDAGRLPNGAAPVGGLVPLGNSDPLAFGGEYGGFPAEGNRVNSVSRDGSSFFFSAVSNEGGDNGKPAVFVRKDPGDVVDPGEIIDASQKVPGGTKDSLGAFYQTASPDGSHVFFTAAYGLTPNSSVGSAQECSNTAYVSVTRCDLYDYNVGSGGLTDLSADANSADSNGAVVQGVVAVSEDGSSVYFAARGQLVTGKGKTYAQNISGTGSANVYLARDGQLTYVATVNASDITRGLLMRTRDWTAEATPDGGHLLFQASANITGYDSGPANGGALEAYLYSAGTDTIQCVSCRPDGLPSVGNPAFAGASTLIESFPNGPSSQSQPRKMSDDGSRVFFYSPDVLAPGAVSGDRNLYEWERGQVYFLATGTPVAESSSTAVPELFGTSTSGEDVFFSTPQQLDPHDTDFVRDVYDARAGGGFPPPAEPEVPCNVAESKCQGTPAPQPPGLSPASQSSSGEGNPPLQPPPCPKGKVRRHGKCVPKKHHRKTAQKRNHSRAANANHGGAK